MTSSTGLYVPALKWRQGEYQALMRLPDAAKQRVKPLVVVPSIEYDFEDNEPKCSAHDHAVKFVKRYRAKWKQRTALIDIDTSLHGETVVGQSFISYIFSELRAAKAFGVPVVSLDYDVPGLGDLAEAASLGGLGVCVRARVEHLMHPNANARFAKLMSDIGVDPGDVDFLVDLGAPNYEPYTAFAKGLLTALTKMADLDQFRSFTMLGTAFPESMQPVSTAGGNLKRHDWLFYKEFVSGLPQGLRKPNFGDYTTVHPAFKADFDMRLIKPAGKVVYTTPDEWLIRKGGAFRDNPTQMYGHCDAIVKSGKFRGANYSNGDDYIAKCAKKEAGPSNLTKWKEISISHHIAQVLEDVAKFGG